MAGCEGASYLYEIEYTTASQMLGYQADVAWGPDVPTADTCSVMAYFERVIANLRQQGSIGTARNYQSSLNSLRRYRQGADLGFDELDHRLVEDYKAWLKAAGRAHNSITFYLRILRAVYNRAVDDGVAADSHPFRKSALTIERTTKRAISMSDIRRIRALDLAGMPPLAFARDIFMFLFLCRGMAFVDAAYLRRSDLANGRISYRRRKTNQSLQVRIEPLAQEIIDRYAVAGSPYLLPIIKRAGAGERLQYENALRRVNKHLNAIGRMLGLSMPLTTYTSRHSWATIAKSKGIPIATISDALGHDSQNTTETYLAQIDVSAIDNANRLIADEL